MTIKLQLDPETVRDAVEEHADKIIAYGHLVDTVVVHKNGGATVNFADPQTIAEYAAGLEEEAE